MKNKTLEKAFQHFDFELGSYVVDELTGFEGVINGRGILDTGNKRYSVKPKVKDDGAMVGGMWVDGDYLTVIPEKSVISKHTTPQFNFANGELVKNIKTPYKGHVSFCIQWITGCLEYEVVSHKLERGFAITQSFSENELKSKRKYLNLDFKDAGCADSPSKY